MLHNSNGFRTAETYENIVILDSDSGAELWYGLEDDLTEEILNKLAAKYGQVTGYYRGGSLDFVEAF